jgi:hypothetical protein
LHGRAYDPEYIPMAVASQIASGFAAVAISCANRQVKTANIDRVIEMKIMWM